MFLLVQFTITEIWINLDAHQLRMDEENVIYIHDGVLLEAKKKLSFGTSGSSWRSYNLVQSCS